MKQAITTTINPYWDEIKDRLQQVVDPFDFARTALTRAIHRATSNPYAEIPILDEGLLLYMHRIEFCRKYAWAIPDPASVLFVAEYAGPKAIEIGAGAGYWAWQLAQLGVDILAYDIAPPNLVADNHWCSPHTAHGEEPTGELREVYHPVSKGGPEECQHHADRTLFLCWPYMNEMAEECLKHYAGKRLIYIGEGQGGCTASDDFFEQLSAQWEQIAEHRPIQWDGIHDWIHVFDRIKEARP